MGTTAAKLAEIGLFPRPSSLRLPTANQPRQLSALASCANGTAAFRFEQLAFTVPLRQCPLPIITQQSLACAEAELLEDRLINSEHATALTQSTSPTERQQLSATLPSCITPLELRREPHASAGQGQRGRCAVQGPRLAQHPDIRDH